MPKTINSKQIDILLMRLVQGITDGLGQDGFALNFQEFHDFGAVDGTHYHGTQVIGGTVEINILADKTGIGSAVELTSRLIETSIFS